MRRNCFLLFASALLFESAKCASDVGGGFMPDFFLKFPNSPFKGRNNVPLNLEAADSAFKARELNYFSTEDRNGRRHIVTSAPPPGFGAGLLPKPLPYKDEKDALFAPHHQQQPARTPPSVFAPKPEENGFSFRNLVDFNLDGLEDRLPSSPGAESGEDGVKNIAYNGYHYGGEPGKYDDGSQVYGFIDQKSKAKKVKTRKSPKYRESDYRRPIRPLEQNYNNNFEYKKSPIKKPKNNPDPYNIDYHQSRPASAPSLEYEEYLSGQEDRLSEEQFAIPAQKDFFKPSKKQKKLKGKSKKVTKHPRRPEYDDIIVGTKLNVGSYNNINNNNKEDDEIRTRRPVQFSPHTPAHYYTTTEMYNSDNDARKAILSEVMRNKKKMNDDNDWIPIPSSTASTPRPRKQHNNNNNRFLGHKRRAKFPRPHQHNNNNNHVKQLPYFKRGFKDQGAITAGENQLASLIQRYPIRLQGNNNNNNNNNRHNRPKPLQRPKLI